MEYQFAYALWTLIFGALWAFFYALRPAARTEMVRFSFVAAPLGPLTQYLHLFDYWRPTTLFGTPISIEDLCIAFFIGGITAGIYSFCKPERERRERDGVLALILCAYVLGVVLMYGGFFVLGLSSVEVAFITLGLFGVVPLIMKPWVWKGALMSGIAFASFLFCFEALFFLAYPGIVDAWWFGATWGRVWGVPYEEIVWGFLWGLAGASGSELVARMKLPRYSR